MLFVGWSHKWSINSNFFKKRIKNILTIDCISIWSVLRSAWLACSIFYVTSKTKIKLKSTFLRIIKMRLFKMIQIHHRNRLSPSGQPSLSMPFFTLLLSILPLSCSSQDASNFKLQIITKKLMPILLLLLSYLLFYFWAVDDYYIL